MACFQPRWFCTGLPGPGSRRNCTKTHTPLLSQGRLTPSWAPPTELGSSDRCDNPLWAPNQRAALAPGLVQGLHTVNRQGHWGFGSLNGKGRPRSERRIPAARPRDGNSAPDQTDHSGAPRARTGFSQHRPEAGRGPVKVRPRQPSLRCRFNRHHSSGMKWTLKGREEAKPLQEQSPGKSSGTGGRQAETTEAGEDGFFIGGTRGNCC